MKVPFAGKKVRVTGAYYPAIKYEGYLVPGPCLDWAGNQVPTHHLRISSGRFSSHEPVFTTDRIVVIQ